MGVRGWVNANANVMREGKFVYANVDVDVYVHVDVDVYAMRG